jgi:hypothetical protein
VVVVSDRPGVLWVCVGVCLFVSCGYVYTVICSYHIYS